MTAALAVDGRVTRLPVGRDVFELAHAFMAPHEGIDADDPDDRGARTRFGISQKRYPLEDIPNLTFERAKYLYRRDFWLGPGFDRIYPSKVAIKAFDFGVNAGPPRSVRVLQRALNDLAEQYIIDIDGELGDLTLNACSEIAAWQSTNAVLYAFCRRQWRYYDAVIRNRPSQRKYTLGWGRRAAAVPDEQH